MKVVRSDHHNTIDKSLTWKYCYFEAVRHYKSQIKVCSCEKRSYKPKRTTKCNRFTSLAGCSFEHLPRADYWAATAVPIGTRNISNKFVYLRCFLHNFRNIFSNISFSECGTFGSIVYILEFKCTGNLLILARSYAKFTAQYSVSSIVIQYFTNGKDNIVVILSKP